MILIINWIILEVSSEEKVWNELNFSIFTFQLFVGWLHATLVRNQEIVIMFTMNEKWVRIA